MPPLASLFPFLSLFSHPLNKGSFQPKYLRFSKSLAQSLQISMKQTWLSVYLSYRPIYIWKPDSSSVRIAALPTLEPSLFTLMCCEHDSGLLIKQGSLTAARGGERNFMTSCLCWGNLGCRSENAHPAQAPSDLQGHQPWVDGVRTLLTHMRNTDLFPLLPYPNTPGL